MGGDIVNLLKFVASVLLLWSLRALAFIQQKLSTGPFIPRSPERFLRFVFSGNRLKILELLSDAYFRFGVFWYEQKIYVLDPKICTKVINKLDKGSHDYLEHSPLATSFLGSTNRSPETRHAIAAIFRKSNMEEKGVEMVACVRRAVEKMKEQQVVNVNEVTLKMALDIVGKVLLKVDLNALEGEEDQLLDAMMTILHRSYALGEVSVLSEEFKEASETVDARASEILTKCLQQTDEERTLPKLLQESGGFEEAVANLKLFLMAGSETTASSIPVLLYLIAENPALQRELQEEADEYIYKVTADPSIVPPKLESATKELLRTYAIAPYVSRRTDTPLTLDNITFPGDADLRIFTWGIHRSPSLWHAPKTFCPSRFLKTDRGNNHQSQTWIPFGAGARICVGQHLAWVELRLALTFFLHNLDFKRIPGVTHDLEFCVDWEHAVVHPDKDVVLEVSSRSH